MTPTDDKRTTPDGPAQEMTFERAMARLEEIVKELEKGTLGLAESLVVFKEGMQLVSRLGTDLDRAEAIVQELVEAADGTLRTRPFVEEAARADEDA